MNSDSVGIERRRLPFIAVDKPLLEDESLSAVDVMTYVALAYFADNSTRECWPSLAKLAKKARCHPSTVSASLSRLEASGYIKRQEQRRRDGGRGSNLYTLMPVSCQRFTPTAQDEGGGRPKQSTPTAQDESNYTHSEQDPNKQREKSVLQVTTFEEPKQSLSPLLSEMKAEALKRGAPFIISAPWSAEVLELQRSGIRDGDLLQAFCACVQRAPERVTFFPRDFLKWRKLSRDNTLHERQQQQRKREKETLEQERKIEREKIMNQLKDPQAVSMVEAAIARLPWKRVKGATA
jgi:hypothetical protein